MLASLYVDLYRGGILTYVLLASCILLFVAAIVLALKFVSDSFNRRRKLAAWAGSRGLTFQPDDDLQIRQRYLKIAILQKKDDGSACNIMSGLWGNQYSIQGFDYQYIRNVRMAYDNGHPIGIGGSIFSIVILSGPFGLRPMTIRRKEFSERVAGLVISPAIEFENDRFNSRFHVECDADASDWGRDVLSPEIQGYLLESPEFTIQMTDSAIALYWDSGDKCFSVQDFEAAANIGAALLDQAAKAVRYLPS